ncbi:MAG: response regulator [Leptospiraceae bacterium]|nr:response regulator [Leptospiraceae bacterium]
MALARDLQFLGRALTLSRFEADAQPAIGYYCRVKLRFMVLFNTVGLISDLALLMMYHYVHPVSSLVYTVCCLAPILFGLALYYCTRRKVRAASIATFCVIAMACMIMPFFGWLELIVFDAIFLFSIPLLSLNRTHFSAYQVLLLLPIALKLLVETGTIPGSVLQPEGMGKSDAWMLLLFLFSIVTYSQVIFGLTDRGLQDADRLSLAQARLEQAHQESEANSQAKSLFLARMNHELRTPLQTALSISELLPPDSEFSTELKTALSQTQIITEEIIDFARITNKNLQPVRIRFALIQELKEMIQVYQNRCKSGVIIRPEIDSDLPFYWTGDRSRFFDIMRNLIGNAVKWCHNGEITVHLGWQNREQHLISGSVQDCGPGIPPTELESIFNPFKQGENGLKAATGMGLGLYLVKTAARHLGGNVSVQNTPAGALFQFWCQMEPCEKWVAHQEQDPAFNCSDCPECVEPLERLLEQLTVMRATSRILIVEDVFVNALLLQKLLSVDGFECIQIAQCGAEAQDQIKNWRPELLFLDLNLPDQNGLELMQKMDGSGHYYRNRTIVFSGDANSAVAAQCKQNGLSVFVSKPARQQDIHKAILEIDQNLAHSASMQTA